MIRSTHSEREIITTNEKMIEYLPELDSEYIRSKPLEWKKPQDLLSNGGPCFVMHPGESSQLEETPLKQDYIWIPGDVHEELLAGYYHLSTREAYREAVRRITLKEEERKTSNLANALKLKFRSKDEKEDDKTTKKVLQLLKSRLRSSEYKRDEREEAAQRRRNSKAEERRRSSLRNSAATIASDISLMGF